jgi:hypothetical protein
MAKKKFRPTGREITLCKQVEGFSLPNEVMYALKPLPYKSIPKTDKLITYIDTELLIAYLRSDIPISPYVRNWLADMLDPKCESTLNMTLKDTKSTAAKKREMAKQIVRNHAAANAKSWMKKEGVKYKKTAVYENESNPQFPVKKSSLNQGMKEQEMIEALVKQVRVIRK